MFLLKEWHDCFCIYRSLCSSMFLLKVKAVCDCYSARDQFVVACIFLNRGLAVTAVEIGL